jgi:hypothetical protein
MALNMWPFRTRAAKGAILVAELLQREAGCNQFYQLKNHTLSKQKYL